MRMLDLCSGTGAASRAAAVRGWEVCRVDLVDGTCADVRADVRIWSAPIEPRWDLIWASPPCDDFSTAQTGPRNLARGLDVVGGCLRIIEQCRPRWWVIENVHGATRAIGTVLGPPVQRIGSFYLWGVFPPIAAELPRNKTRLSGRRRAERRAAIPWALSEALVLACERLARELGGDCTDPRRFEGSSATGLADGQPARLTAFERVR